MRRLKLIINLSNRRALDAYLYLRKYKDAWSYNRSDGSTDIALKAAVCVIHDRICDEIMQERAQVAWPECC